jgi:translocation and assembly module TamB
VRYGTTIRWGLLAVAVIIIVAAVGGYWVLKSAAFHQYALRKITAQVAESTGARAEIGSLDFSLSTLTAHLNNITVHGSESTGAKPLLQVEELTVGVKVLSVLHRQINLAELSIRHPVVHIQVDRQGKTNIPQPRPSQSSSQTNVFDLAIGHFAITNGEVDYNDKKTPLDADVYDLQTDVAFTSLSTAYKGAISYSNGQIAYAQYAPFTHSASIRFAASPSKLSIESAQAQIGSSKLSLHAEVSNFTEPSVTGDYDVIIHGQDFAAMLRPVKADGDVHMRGTIRYQSESNQPALRSLEVTGQLECNGLSATSPDGKIDIRKINAQYDLADGNLRVREIAVESLGGRIGADVEILNLDTKPAARVHAALEAISLRAVQQSVRQARSTPIAVSGTLDGVADATWTGSINNLRARSDLRVRANAKEKSSESSTVPVDALIHAAYDASSSSLVLRQSNLKTSAFTLTADGEVSHSSSLKIHAQISDLHQLEQLASSFVPSQTTLPAISGSATLDTTIRGSLQKPELSGQLDASNVHVEGSDWTQISTSFSASPSRFALSNGSLVNANQGRATFDATAALRDWSYAPENAIGANLNVRQMSIADLEHLAKVQYPISGDLSAHVSLTGSQLNPSGSGSANISNARAYGEPFQTLALKFNASNGSITAGVNVAASAGSAITELTFTPKTGAYKLKLDAPAVTLEKLHALHEKQTVRGTLSLSATGEGTLDNPQLNATLGAANLEVSQKMLAGLKANIAVVNKRANLTLDTQASQTSIHAHAQVELTGNYQTDASIDTGAIPLDTLFATFSTTVPAGFQGQTELHATLKGPLKNMALLEAHVTIPTLNAAYQELKIGNAAPIKADYANSVITLQPAELKGTGTSLRLQGSIPLSGSSSPNLTAQGTIDVGILRIFEADLHSSGTVSLDLHAAGSPSNPSIQGQVRLQDITMSTPTAPIGVENLNGTLNAQSDRVQISNLNGQVGGGEVSLGGSIIYRPNLQFALALQGKSIRLRYPTGLRTVLESNLALSGNMQSSTLTGRVLIESLSFTPDFDISKFGDQFSNSVSTPAQPGFADTVNLNVAVQSKENLSANSSQVSLEGAVALNVAGTAANPVITGRTELTSGELFYRGNRYQLQRGLITFADPNQTNPNLNVSVTTNVEQYNLTIGLRGTIDRLTTTYSSDPPLSTADVIHLIAFGNTTSESAAASNSQSTDAMVASSAIGAGLTNGVNSLAGLSSLQIDPLLGGNNQNPSARIALQQRVTKNFLFTFSTDVSQPGQEVVEGDYQINKRWSVTVTRDQLGGVTVAGRLHTKF